MRHAVLAATLVFGPQVRLFRRPARSVVHAVMSLLDRRRRMIDNA
jgi:hypothetical protein